MLAYFTQKTQKKMEQQAALQHERAMQQINATTQGQLQVEAARKDRELAVEDRKGYYYVVAQKSKNEADLAKKQMDIDSNDQKVNEKADANIKEKRENANLTAQEPLPVSASELPDQQPAVA